MVRIVVRIIVPFGKDYVIQYRSSVRYQVSKQFSTVLVAYMKQWEAQISFENVWLSDVADELKLEADVCGTHERLIPQKRNDATAFPLEMTPTAASDLVDRNAAQHTNNSSVSREAK